MNTTSDRLTGKRLDEIAVALALIMTGGLWLAPSGLIPEGAWLAGAGLILLGLNAARRVRGIKASGFGVIVGFVALAAGVGRILGRNLPFWPALLIVLGIALTVKGAAAPRKSESGPGICDCR